MVGFGVCMVALVELTVKKYEFKTVEISKYKKAALQL
jgi:hypothetical protein